jgi:SAM-dependent methyltransferase
MNAGAMWGGAEYERVAELLTPVHEELVARLSPRPGERWLDVATGTGAVALRAARAGADVTGVDIAPALIEQAERAADAEGLQIRLDVGDALSLPYENGSFDVVCSCFGVIFAPEPEAAARELGRVCRPEGRLGVTAWRPDQGLHAVFKPFLDRPPPVDADYWGDEDNVRGLLEPEFVVDISEGEWILTGESGESLWEFSATAVPPCKALAESLDTERREELRRAMVAHFEDFRVNGGIRQPRGYLLVTGRRR